MKKQIVTFAATLIVIFSVHAQDSDYLRYIDNYKDIAVEQMHKYHIPASITLAQALLESGAGKSELARNSNNHFGIKCHSWEGDRTYPDDDSAGECFRVYKNVRDSYEDHSIFLSSGSRYAFLFKFDETDYVSWARGLKRAGYATSPTYADKLIDIIERYELDRFDKGEKVNIDDPSKIVAITHKTYYPLPYVNGKTKYTYVVTALDRMQNESNLKKKKIKL